MITDQMVATRTELVVENGLAVGGHLREAEAGVRILQEGGNAVDALVAAAFVGFVVEPASCGIGGYGRLSIFMAEPGEFVTVDHYVRAPLKAHPRMFEVDPSADWHYYGHPQTVGRKAEQGYLSPAVPGAVAGLHAAHEMFGRLPWAQVLEPAIEAAEVGVPVEPNLVLYIAGRMAEIQAYPHAAAFLLPDGFPPGYASPFSQGHRLDTSDLARTLRRIAAEGPAAFYTGPIAEAIDREVTGNGGILSAADLAAYRPKILREKPARYRAFDYITAYDQVAYEALNILDQFDLRRFGPDSLAFRHLVSEVLGHAFMDNKVHYGDPEHVSSPVNGLASRLFAEKRAEDIRLDRAAPRPIAAADPWPFETSADAPETLPMTPTLAKIAGTSQMATVDREGNMTALITSLSNVFGSLILVPDTGILLNNSMQNFDPRPEHPNCIQPGKIPIFAAPSLVAVEEGMAQFSGCGSGGYRIMTGVLHTFLHVADFGMSIQEAVDAPRVHCQGFRTYVDGRIPQGIRDRLAEMGHLVVPQTDVPGATHFGRVCAIWVDPTNGLMHAGSGPAWGTAAAGF
jgi:gamma-glutamyltranspeptidase/glutathione hydrolase